MPHPRLRLSVFCVSLLVPAVARAQVPADPPAVARAQVASTSALTEAAETQRRSAARKLYSERRYREAAHAYEALWRDTGAAKYRFNAGMAREAAEHYGAALLHWQAYLASGSATPEERRMLEQRVTTTSAQLGRVHIHIASTLPGPATLTLHAPEPAPQGPRDPIELAVQPDLDLAFEPGTWSVTLQLADQPPIVARFDLSAGVASPTVTLTLPVPAIETPPTPPPLPVPVDLTLTIAPQRALARGVELQWSSSEAASASAAVSSESTGSNGSQPQSSALAASGSQTLPRATRSPVPLRLPTGAYTLRIRAPGFAEQTVAVDLATTRQLDLRLRPDATERARLGLALGLGGTGLVLGAIGTGFIVRGAGELADQRRVGALPNCLTPERCSAAVNGALDLSSGLAMLGSGLGAGIVAATVGARAQDRALKLEAGFGAGFFVGGLIWYVAEIQGPYTLQHRARDHVAAMMLGSGAGLLGAATISLVTRRLVRRKHPAHALAPALSPNSVGLTWHARF